MNNRLFHLLCAWIESRSVRGSARSTWPQAGYAYQLVGNALQAGSWIGGKWKVGQAAVCLERSTNVIHDRVIDEVGWAFLSIPIRDRLIILSLFIFSREPWLRGVRWEKWLGKAFQKSQTSAGRKRDYSASLRAAWGRFEDQAARRGVL